MRYREILIGILSILAGANSLAAESTEVLLDAVAASVNGEPITLVEVSQRLQTDQLLSLKQLADDRQARQVLEMLIAERILAAEAAAQKITVSSSEIEAYINRIAARNQLSRSAFEQALATENKNIEDFKKQVRLEILRSKLAAQIMRSGVAVSTQEINEYLASHPEITQSGVKLKLSQILISTEKHSPVGAETKIAEIRKQLLSGADFAKLAAQYSDAPEAAQGGSLGVLSEQDLSPMISSAVSALQKDEPSEVVHSPLGYHIFRVEQRFQDNQGDQEQLEKEVRQILKNQKLETTMQSYFSTELYQKHTVERKIEH